MEVHMKSWKAFRCLFLAMLFTLALFQLDQGKCFAQSVPQLINYQGRLTDSSGQPLDGVTVDLAFSFYGSESGSTVFLSVLQEDVQVNKGIYHVLIGSGTITPGTENSLADVFQKHTDVWMGVKVDTDPEMTPRTRISSVAYSLMSDKADQANSVGPGTIMAESIGEDCALGEVLVKTAIGWQCTTQGTMYAWIWMSGSDVKDQYGVYGTKGTPDPGNVPGSRYGSASWTDASGDMWLFGGEGYPGSGLWGGLNDLWRWDGASWTWMSGSNISDQNGVYGTKGTPAPSNIPGARQNAVSWTDASGNLWLFGGEGYAASGGGGYLNDLWRWDGTNWTWMSGSDVINQNGIYGIKGTPDAGNAPGSRAYAVSWTDDSDNLWLFGGFGYPANGTTGRLNDLWRWDGSEWTWISGSDGTNQNGVYGTKGIPDPANVPGSRYGAVSWTDPSDNFWFFGGEGYAASGGLGYLNDLWRWDGTNWTWMSGDNVTNQNGVYGTKGTPDLGNVPGSRAYAVSWTDLSGSMWLFGGYGYPASGTYGYLNDLWRWDGAEWTWIRGSDVRNQNGVYGTRSTLDSANVPGSRRLTVSWTDSSGNFWLFGGYGYPASGGLGSLNDLWKYK
jgi:hypothetical protein